MLVDVDECATKPSPCDQRCVNVKGSYKCLCYDGSLPDNGRCKSVQDEREMSLIFSDRVAIKRITLIGFVLFLIRFEIRLLDTDCEAMHLFAPVYSIS